jgi:hypothetical protein
LIAFGSRLVLLGAVAFAACDKRPSTQPALPSTVSEPRWESLLDPPPDMLLLVRPHALLQDALYGPLLGHVVQLSRQHSRIVTAASALATLENADEVLVGAHDLRTADFFVVVRGVPADVDPVTLVDEQRRPLWTTTSSGPLHELTRAPSPPDADDRLSDTRSSTEASLFELPGRTWVIASGAECARARRTLSHPNARNGAQSEQHPPAIRLDDGPDAEAIASLRLTGPALVDHVSALHPPGLLATVGRELDTVTVVLWGGRDARLRATFFYDRESARAAAEATLRDTIAALFKAKPQTFAWLRSASVQRTRCCAVLTIPLPPQLLDVLATAGDGGA